MGLVIDKEFLRLVSSDLKLFTEKSGNVYNFRCPFCMDSAKNEYKKRGYVYERDNSLKFHCHNCGASGFKNLLKKIDPRLADEYVLKSFISREEKPNFKYNETIGILPMFKIDENLKLSNLNSNHAAVRYLLDERKFKPEFLEQFYYTDNYLEFIGKFIGTVKKRRFDDARIIIPLRNREGKLIGIQGRKFDENSPFPRYSIHRIDNSANHLDWNYDKVDTGGPVYLFEGVFDAIWIPNAMAVLGSAMANFNLENGVCVFDNEPRHKDLVPIIKKTIERNRKIVIWPKDFEGLKDVNSMVISGISENTIYQAIRENTFQGPRAMLEFENWREI